MKQGSFFYWVALVCSLLALLIGYALYSAPKNYEVLEIDARNDNYAIVGLFLGWIALILDVIAIVTIKAKKRRIFLGIELTLSIILLLLWWRY